MCRTAAAIICVYVLSSAAVAVAEWYYELGIYGWLAGLEGTIGVATTWVCECSSDAPA